MRYKTAALLGLAVSLALPAAAAGAEFTVNSTTDRVDSNPGNGSCRTSSGTCTLRAAIQEANARPGADTVRLRSGTHQLTIAARGTNGADSGDLDVTGPTTIAGAGATASVVNGRALDRVLELHVAAGDVTLTGLTIREARVVGDGGAIASHTSGRLRLASKDGRTLEVQPIATTWSETTVQWTTQPPAAGPVASAVTRSGWIEWDVRAAVAAGAAEGFLVRDQAENGDGFEQGFNSREKGTDSPPQLVVTFGP